MICLESKWNLLNIKLLPLQTHLTLQYINIPCFDMYHRLALQLVEFSQTLPFTPHLVGRECTRHRHLQAAGYTVVQVGTHVTWSSSQIESIVPLKAVIKCNVNVVKFYLGPYVFDKILIFLEILSNLGKFSKNKKYFKNYSIQLDHLYIYFFHCLHVCLKWLI